MILARRSRLYVLLIALAFSVFILLTYDQTYLQSNYQTEQRLTSNNMNGQCFELVLDKSVETSTKSICPAIPLNLGRNLEIVDNITLMEAEIKHSNTVNVGGSWWPRRCTARSSIALIVPFRNRDDQVGPFLNHMHEFLQRQLMKYAIYIVKQEDQMPFNRAKLLNIGIVESLKESSYDCYVFHDVDLLPEDSRNSYHCSDMPRLLAVSYSQFEYVNMYPEYFGGASMMKESHIRIVNGWSNKYWGWGSEDDDMFRRIVSHNLTVWRYPVDLARYKMLPHVRAIADSERYQKFNENILHFDEDGLNSLQYKLISIDQKTLFTEIKVNLNFTESVDQS